MPLRRNMQVSSGMDVIYQSATRQSTGIDRKMQPKMGHFSDMPCDYLPGSARVGRLTQLDRRSTLKFMLSAFSSWLFIGTKSAFSADVTPPTESTERRLEDDDDDDDDEDLALFRTPCGKDCMTKCFENFGAALVPGNSEYG
jgi:hypothetical protein